MDYRSFIGFFSRVARIWRPPVQQHSRFLDLPLDVTYAIIDELSLSSRILLSQTCRALFYQMSERCFSALRRCTAEQRLEILNDLKNLLPDQYLCMTCNALHCIDYGDFPANKDRGSEKSYKPCSLFVHWEETHRVLCYATSFHHVQLAAKYTHMNTRHQYYRERLLQKYEFSYPDYDSLALKFTAEPRVIMSRYILMSACTFSAGSEPLSFESLSKVTIMFCPHWQFGPVADVVKYPLGAAVQQAFHSLGDERGAQPKLFSCGRCPTDFSILAKEHEAHIVCWSDLGMGDSLQDPCWQSHLWSLENSCDKGSSFEYNHGSVRELYSSCPT